MRVSHLVSAVAAGPVIGLASAALCWQNAQCTATRMMSELSARTTGDWRPSTGSIYPTLQALENDGLVTATTNGDRRSYTLTEAGRAAGAAPDLPSPWEQFTPPADPQEAALREAAAQLLGAVNQALLGGTGEQQARVTEC